MRELKFRAYIGIENKVVDVSTIDFDEEVIGVLDVNLAGCHFIKYRDFDQVKLMQYTGFKDKSGKEIYGGDILQYILDEENGDTGVVKMHSSGFWIVEIKEIEDFDPLCDWLDGNIKLLGNIYENPELCEVRK